MRKTVLFTLAMFLVVSGCTSTLTNRVDDLEIKYSTFEKRVGTLETNSSKSIEVFQAIANRLDLTDQKIADAEKKTIEQLASMQSKIDSAVQNGLEKEGIRQGEIARLRRSIQQVADLTSQLGNGDTIFYTISGFLSGEGSLPAGMKPLLDGVAMNILAKKLTVVKIVGWSDPAGNYQRNVALAKARAEAALAYLAEEKNISMANVSVEAGGVTTLGETSERNRCVQIFCVYQPAPPATP